MGAPGPGEGPITALDLVQSLDFRSRFVNKPLIPGFTLVSQAAICQNPLPDWEVRFFFSSENSGRCARTNPVGVFETLSP